MTFLSPLLLAGLFLAAIPFVIHLFNFRRPRKIDFSSLEFIRELKKTTMQKVRVKQWLLLLLRTLALICLCLVFARPSLNSRLAAVIGGDSRTSVGVVIDNSQSMSLRNSDGGYLEQARVLAEKIAEKIEPGDDFSLSTLSSQAPSTYIGYSSAQAGVQAVELAPSRQSVVDASRELIDLLDETDTVNKELYIITDGQRSTIGDSLATETKNRVGGYVIQIGSAPPENLAVTSVDVASRIIEAGQPATLIATIQNYGQAAVENYVVSAFIENVRVAQATVDIPANASTAVELVITPQSRGWLAGNVRLEDDAFESDNLRHFTLNVPDVRKILLVRGDNQSASYILAAIDAGKSDGRALFNIRTVNESQLAAANVDDYHIVYLVGVEDLSSGEISVLSNFVQNGGGLIVFPSRSSSIADYNGLFAELQGGRIEGFIGAEANETAVTRLDSYENEHPLFEGIFDANADGDIEKPEVFFAVDYRPVRGTEQTLMTLANGKPLMQEMKSGSGSALFFTVLPDPAWSDLPVRGLFVPLLFRSMYYLSSSSSSGFAELISGRDGQFVFPGSIGEDGLELRIEGGREFSPVIRAVSGGTLVVVPASENHTGVTKILRDSTVIGMIPVNPDPLESDLNTFADGEIGALLSSATGVEMELIAVNGLSGTDLDELVTTARTGTELWRPLLFAGLLLLIVEMLVARLWVPESV